MNKKTIFVIIAFVIIGLVIYRVVKSRKNKTQETPGQANELQELQPPPAPAPVSGTGKPAPPPPKISEPERQKRTAEIWAAMGNGTAAVLRIPGRFGAFYFDNSDKKWKPTGGNFDVKPGAKIYKSTATRMLNGFIAPVTTTSGQVRNLFITPEYLYV